MITALEDVVKYIECNFVDIIALSEIDKSNKDRIIAKATIEFQQNSEDSNYSYGKKSVILEISQNGFRTLEKQDSKYFESIESFLHSEAPEAWIKYFETKITEKFQE